MRISDPSAWWSALLLLAVSFLGAGWISVRPSSGPDAAIAAVFPPWWSAERSLAAAASAGGAIIRTGAWSNILVVRSNDDGFAERLRFSGAVLLVNPKALGACFKEKA